jgi:hypothetical protein
MRREAELAEEAEKVSIRALSRKKGGQMHLKAAAELKILCGVSTAPPTGVLQIPILNRPVNTERVLSSPRRPMIGLWQL